MGQFVEKIFALLSIAIVGSIAISCAPNVKPEPSKPAVTSVGTQMNDSSVDPNDDPSIPSIQNEINAVQEVELINSGRFGSR